MSYDYGPLTATANRLIGQFGAAQTLRRYPSLAGQSYGATQGAATDYTVTAVRSSRKVMDAEGGLVSNTQEAYTIRVQEGVVPQKDDFLVIDGAERRIVAVSETRPGDSTLLYKVYVDG